ncbi:MAG: hypothetical protein Alpg2KO_07850 [Alphaproteobacteria bacterium]
MTDTSPDKKPDTWSAYDGPLKGRRILITSGPTEEPLDPVRMLTNRSSGKMGRELALAMRNAGAKVIVMLGPNAERVPSSVTYRDVRTADEMLQGCLDNLPVDAVICAAAVCDWKLRTPAIQKMKKGQEDTLTLTFEKTPDILATLSKPGPDRPTVVLGFAAETGDLLRQAREKLARKGCDGVLANDVSGGAVFGADDSHLWLITPEGETDLGAGPKKDLAERIVPILAAMLDTRNPINGQNDE